MTHDASSHISLFLYAIVLFGTMTGQIAIYCNSIAYKTAIILIAILYFLNFSTNNIYYRYTNTIVILYIINTIYYFLPLVSGIL